MYNEYDYIMTSNGELYHYGVKGMKWGKRKAQKYAKEANVYRQGLKDWEDERAEEVGRLRAQGREKKARKLDAAYEKQINENKALIKKYEDKSARANREANFQKAQADIGKSRKTGHKLATNLLAGPFANRTYNSVIAAGGSRVAAAGITYATGMIGGPIGHIAVAHLYTKTAGDGNTRKRY